MTRKPRKPGYTLTRAAFWISFYLAWGVILAILTAALAGNSAAPSLATTYVPSMVLMVAGVLGIHRAFGSIDLRSQASTREPKDDAE